MEQLTVDHFYFSTFIMAQAGGGSASGKIAGLPTLLMPSGKIKQCALDWLFKPCLQTVIVQKAAVSSVSFHMDTQFSVPLQLEEVLHGNDRVIRRSQGLNRRDCFHFFTYLSFFCRAGPL